MKKLQDVIQLVSGSPQFRITESPSPDAPIYSFYGQQELDNDLCGIEVNKEDPKQIATFDTVNTLDAGDIVFSLTSGKTSIVQKNHQGYLFTQNFIKMIPSDGIDNKYLVYIMNESDFIKKQWLVGLQGSSVIKYTVKQIKELDLPEMPTMDKQQIIGDIYFDQLRLQALQMRAADTERIITFKKLKEVNGVWKKYNLKKN